MSVFNCSMCCYQSHSMNQFRSHYIRLHRNDPNFIAVCGIDGCKFSTKKWVTFRVHFHRNHRHDINIDNNVSNVNNNGTGIDEIDLSSFDHNDSNDNYTNSVKTNDSKSTVDVEFSNARFAMALESRDRMTKTSVDRVLAACSFLVTDHVLNFKNAVENHLRREGINSSFLESIDYSSGFQNLFTSKKRDKYYSSHMLTYIKPQEVLLGKRKKLIKGLIKDVSDFGYIVPFKQNLENLLNMPEITQQMERPHTSKNSSFLYDVCDGNIVNDSIFLKNHQNALQIAISTDDLEIVNPIGTKVKKHKITVYYFSLLNILPQFRSRINSIQLLAVAKTKYLKSHNATSKLLHDFISTINQLSTCGVSMQIQNKSKLVYGILILVIADTLAAHELGKFKEGVSFAMRCCRHCDVETKEINAITRESHCILRDTISHRERCLCLDTLNRKTKSYWSKMWGVNGTSCLLNINQFEFISGLVQDPMHVLLEGVVPYYIALAFYNFIYVSKLLSLKQLNNKILTFQYSYLHSSSKPCPVEKNQLVEKLSLKQTSSSMLTLCETLPYIISSYIPEGNRIWRNVLRLIGIVNLCTSHYCSRETPEILSLIIAEFLNEFKQLHPRATFIPKMHYMVHFPSQMKNYGPLRHHWCMRYEAKHTVFTQKRYKNFKNLPFTLINEHQLKMCYFQGSSKEGERSNNFLYEGDVVGNGEVIRLMDKYPQFISSQYSDNDSEFFSTKTINIQGFHYVVNECAIVFDYDEFDSPSFGIIRDILILNDIQYLLIESTNSYLHKHLGAYSLSLNGNINLVAYTCVKYKSPLSIYNRQGKLYVINSKSHVQELF